MENFFLWASKAINNNTGKCVLLSAFFLILFAPGLKDVKFDFRVSSWFSKSDPAKLKYDNFIGDFGSDDSVIISLNRADNESLFKPETLKDLENLTEELWFTQGILRVESLANYMDITAEDDDLIIKKFLDSEEEYSVLETESLKKKGVKI